MRSGTKRPTRVVADPELVVGHAQRHEEANGEEGCPWAVVTTTLQETTKRAPS
jgi:hypothetical protein